MYICMLIFDIFMYINIGLCVYSGYGSIICLNWYIAHVVIIHILCYAFIYILETIFLIFITNEGNMGLLKIT